MPVVYSVTVSVVTTVGGSSSRRALRLDFAFTLLMLTPFLAIRAECGPGKIAATTRQAVLVGVHVQRGIHHANRIPVYTLRYKDDIGCQNAPCC